MKNETETARNNEFVKEFKELCKRYGFVDHLILKGIEQSISIKVSSRVRDNGIIETCINKNKDGIRNKMKIVGQLRTVIPELNPEDEYKVLDIDISIVRIEESVKLINRKELKANKIEDKLNRFPLANDSFERFLPFNPDPYAKY